MALDNDQLDLLDRTGEVHIRTRSDRGSFETIIWIVVVDDVVYVRSVQGEDGRWYQRALADPAVAILVDGQEIDLRAVSVDDPDEIASVTKALTAKYPAGVSLDRMVRDEVLETTLRLEPAT